MRDATAGLLVLLVQRHHQLADVVVAPVNRLGLHQLGCRLELDVHHVAVLNERLRCQFVQRLQPVGSIHRGQVADAPVQLL